MVKAQVHAGGRGKAGGVKIAQSLDEVEILAASMLGKALVTYQNAPDGQPVKKVLVEETLAIARELYLSILVDREAERVAVVASASGGMDIEEVARVSPDKILKAHCDPVNGLMPYQCRELAFGLGLKAEAFQDFCALLPKLYRLFRGKRSGAAGNQSADRHARQSRPAAGLQDERGRQRAVPAEGACRD